MEVLRRSFADQFLIETLAYRASEPLRTNVLASVAASVAAGHRNYRETWWWLVQEDRAVLGAAIRTAPYGLHLGPMSQSAAAALAQAAAEQDDAFPWVRGPESTLSAFLDAYRATASPGSRRDGRHGKRENIYRLDELSPPEVPGAWRTATPSDHSLARTWMIEFLEFIDGPIVGAAHYDDEALRHRLRAGALGFWTLGDEPVAMAGHAEPVTTPAGRVVRIGPVYTPEPLRGRGYAAAATAALSAQLGTPGTLVMLHADVENPTSNAIYQRLGFTLVDTLSRVDFLQELP